MTTRDEVSDMIDEAQLGALADEGEWIGDALKKMWRAWSYRNNRDIEIPDYLGEQLRGALDQQNAAYDEDGYVMHAPEAHAAKGRVAGIIDEITAAVESAEISRTPPDYEYEDRLHPVDDRRDEEEDIHPVWRAWYTR